MLGNNGAVDGNVILTNSYGGGTTFAGKNELTVNYAADPGSGPITFANTASLYVAFSGG